MNYEDDEDDDVTVVVFSKNFVTDSGQRSAR